MHERLIELITKIYGDKVEIDANTSLSNDLSFTSIHFVQLIVEIESTFGFEFDDEDMDLSKLDRLGNINDIIALHI